MQNFAELHLKPGTLELYGFRLRVELIVAGACVLQRWEGL